MSSKTDEKLKSVVGDNIEFIRKLHDLTQAKFAALFINPKTGREYERHHIESYENKTALAPDDLLNQIATFQNILPTVLKEKELKKNLGLLEIPNPVNEDHVAKLLKKKDNVISLQKEQIAILKAQVKELKKAK